MGVSALQLVLILGFGAAITGCAKLPEEGSCAPEVLESNTGSQGVAAIFSVDPVVASQDPLLSPLSLKLNDYRSQVSLSRLGGRGVLEGQYVEVRNGLFCKGWFGAFEKKNEFVYPHEDFRFQEAMVYSVGDGYRSWIDQLGYLKPIEPVRILAHCKLQDNAYYVRQRDSSGQSIPTVCLGDSVSTLGAFYGDDGVVTIHELQHATTTELYTNSQHSESLNQFWYDEAGALNEAVSDFMALAYTAPSLPSLFDPKQFSRWALDRFYPNYRGTRGAHRCPEYDGSFKTGCGQFPLLSSDANHVSFVYPDGLGWPYANNSSGPDYVRMAYKRHRSQEEIHNNATILEGALWDVYEQIRANHDEVSAQSITTKAALEALRHLPKPSSANLSPVTFRSFAQAFLTFLPLIGGSSADVAAASQALAERGLIGGTPVPSHWADRGDGMAATPGMKIEDQSQKLKSWLISMGSNPNLVQQGLDTGLNSQLDPGEVVALWFDVKNVSPVTAGAVQVTVSTQDQEITFLDGLTNVGPVSSKSAQVQYFKINGTAAQAALNGPTYPTGAGNSYFTTNSFFAQSWTTAVWVKVSASAAHGKIVQFQLDLTPSNGEAATVNFPVTIH